LDHAHFIHDADIKCVVCWNICGKNSKNHRCSQCQDYNLMECLKCLHRIKVHIASTDLQNLCKYCGGDYERTSDFSYIGTTDYYTKYRITNLKSLTINICSNCYVPSTIVAKDKLKCDMCNKYEFNTLEINRLEFLTITQKCKGCCAYSDNDICCTCKSAFDSIPIKMCKMCKQEKPTFELACYYKKEISYRHPLFLNYSMSPKIFSNKCLDCALSECNSKFECNICKNEYDTHKICELGGKIDENYHETNNCDKICDICFDKGNQSEVTCDSD